MGSHSKQSSNEQKQTTINSRRRRRSTRRRVSGGCCGGAPAAAHSSVSEKLEALKQLIPAINGERKTEQLFEETAEYIVLLRNQVSILQKLIDIYDSPPPTDSSLNLHLQMAQIQNF